MFSAIGNRGLPLQVPTIPDLKLVNPSIIENGVQVSSLS
jgi:hypothetical protein